MNTITKHIACAAALLLFGSPVMAQDRASDDGATEQPAPYEVRPVDVPEASASETPNGLPAPAERPAPLALSHAEGEATPALPPYEVLLVELPEVPAHEVGGTAPASPDRRTSDDQ